MYFVPISSYLSYPIEGDEISLQDLELMPAFL
jgi:hypothetical protein